MFQGASISTRVSQLLAVSVCIVSAPLGALPAQLIPVKTARVAEADLAGYFPSANGGMGRLLTLPDSLLDAYNNPAAGRGMRRPHIIGSLATYSVSHDLGTGSTTPLGIFAPLGKWFAGASLARQSVSPPDGFGFAIADAAQKNTYSFLLLGRSLGSASIGASASWSTLGALDGAELLYPGMFSLLRTGGASDLRLGATKQFSGGSTVEAVVLNVRSSFQHEVTYHDRMWDPNQQTTVETTRIDRDRDRTETYGAHVTMSRPLRDTTWRVGAGVTANRIAHTLMPVLGATSLSRDPGRSTAIDATFGLSRRFRTLRYGADAVYEPIWSRITLDGTANNDRYRFNNAVLRAGVSADYHPLKQETAVRFLMGAQMRAINYRRDYLDSALVATTSHANWNEWTHNFGVSFLDKAVLMHLQWRVQSGARRPGLFTGSPFSFGAPGGASGTGMLATRVSTLQIVAEVPIR